VVHTIFVYLGNSNLANFQVVLLGPNFFYIICIKYTSFLYLRICVEDGPCDVGAMYHYSWLMLYKVDITFLSLVVYWVVSL